jgi:hypothetical protein
MIGRFAYAFTGWHRTFSLIPAERCWRSDSHRVVGFGVGELARVRRERGPMG